MGIRVHKMLGWGLTDVEVDGYRVTDQRINPKGIVADRWADDGRKWTTDDLLAWMKDHQPTGPHMLTSTLVGILRKDGKRVGDPSDCIPCQRRTRSAQRHPRHMRVGRGIHRPRGLEAAPPDALCVVVMTLAVDALAAYRLTRLVVSDKITAPWRDRVIRNAYLDSATSAFPSEEPDDWTEYAQDDARPPFAAGLISCRACASVYVGFCVVAARRFAPRLWGPVADALALSAVAALMGGAERD